MYSTVCACALALILAAIPGSSLVQAGEGKKIIRVATMAPRSQKLGLEAKRYNRHLAELTDGKVQFRTYWGGVAGNDRTVLRKLRTGQLDAAPMGVQIISQFVRQAMIMVAPRTFHNYRQVDAVRKELGPELNQEAYKNGFKVLSWWDAGKVRIMSKKPIRNFNDLRTGRPWLYPESPLLREFYKMIGATGVPLGLREVYGGLQTGMIDTVWISAVLGMVFRWHTKTEFISADPVNIIQGAFVIRRPTWEGLADSERTAIEVLNARQMKKIQMRFRRDDDASYAKLLRRGFSSFKFENPKLWEQKGKELRDKMVGRLYRQELLTRVEGIAAQYN